MSHSPSGLLIHIFHDKNYWIDLDEVLYENYDIEDNKKLLLFNFVWFVLKISNISKS
jgi:hypothetical protein